MTLYCVARAIHYTIVYIYREHSVIILVAI